VFNNKLKIKMNPEELQEILYPDKVGPVAEKFPLFYGALEDLIKDSHTDLDEVGLLTFAARGESTERSGQEDYAPSYEITIDGDNQTVTIIKKQDQYSPEVTHLISLETSKLEKAVNGEVEELHGKEKHQTFDSFLRLAVNEEEAVINEAQKILKDTNA
jgi:hypothetical protein